MNRKLTIASLVIVVALGAGISIYFSKADDPKVGATTIPVMPPVKDLPYLNVQMGDNTLVNLRDLEGDIVLIFFNPDCDHCQDQARDIAANKSVFEKWQVYFIASLDAKTAEEFGVNYRLTEPNYRFGSSPVEDVFNAVGTLHEVPTIVIFKQSRLIRKFEGLTPIDQLREILQPT